MANLVKQLLQPIAIVWLILIVMCVWQIYRHQYRWASINGLMVFGLFLFGCTPLSGYLLSTLEKPYVCENLDVLPEADVVVVLGGMVSGSSIEPTGFDVGDAADRILTGLELIRLGKAKHLIVGGGAFGPRAHSESEYFWGKSGTKDLKNYIKSCYFCKDSIVSSLGSSRTRFFDDHVIKCYKSPIYNIL